MHGDGGDIPVLSADDHMLAGRMLLRDLIIETTVYGSVGVVCKVSEGVNRGINHCQCSISSSRFSDNRTGRQSNREN